MSARLIALTGPAGSGKTTIALELQRRGFVRVRFAGPLKDMLRTLGLSDAQVDGDAKEEPSALLCGKTPRHAMQTLGTQWGRELIGPDVWVNAAMQIVDTLLEGHRNVVIDDCRFDNEARAILARGGSVVRLARKGANTDLSHASEQPVSDELVALRITNDEDSPGPVTSFILNSLQTLEGLK